MKTILTKIYSYIIGIKNHVLWQIQAANVKTLTTSSCAVEFHSTSHIIVIAPHADDELIGCHQLILNHRHLVTIFYCGYLGSNQSETNRTIREKEIIAYSRYQNCNLIISAPNTIQADLRKAIEQLKPEYVFLPSYVDWHDEHRLINNLLVSIRPSHHIKVGWYHVSLPIPGVFVTAFSTMSKTEYLKKWKAMIICYPSQLHMNLSRCKYIEKLGTKGNEYRETYIIMSFDRYCIMVEKLALRPSEQFQSLKATLGDIERMYTETNHIYKTLNINY